jgi:hypothetical protein
MEQHTRRVHFEQACAARPEVLYDLLNDLRTHLEWGGARQSRQFRLETLTAPAGPAIVGTSFASTGKLPMSGRRWNDRSTVTVALRPSTFEFVTEARAREAGGEMAARYVHRYEIAPDGAGSRVTYVLTEEHVAAPMLRFSVPGVRVMTWWLARFMFARGFRNLLTMAADSRRETVPGVHSQYRKEA